MKKRTTGARIQLGQELNDDLADYCAATHDVPAINVIRDAVRGLIDARLEDEPRVKERFMAARRKRLETTKSNGLRIVGPEGDDA